MSRFTEWRRNTVLGQFLWCAFWVCVICTPFAVIIWDAATHNSMPAEWEMQSVTRGSAIQGSFFLGTGSIDQNMYYISYIKGLEGGTYLKAFPATCSVVFEGYEHPHVKFKKEYSRLRRWFRIPPPSTHPAGYRDRMSCSECGCAGIEYELYVPTGTVIKEFRLQ